MFRDALKVAPPRPQWPPALRRRLELAAEPEFDVTIVNDEVERATAELVACMGLPA